MLLISISSSYSFKVIIIIVIIYWLILNNKYVRVCLANLFCIIIIIIIIIIESVCEATHSLNGLQSAASVLCGKIKLWDNFGKRCKWWELDIGASRKKLVPNFQSDRLQRKKVMLYVYISLYIILLYI